MPTKAEANANWKSISSGRKAYLSDTLAIGDSVHKTNSVNSNNDGMIKKICKI